MANYSELLKDPRWQKKRLEVLQRDGFKCQLCQDTETELHIHHKEYKYGNEPWEYGQENFITYCKHCHRVIEDIKKIGLKEIFTAKKDALKGTEIFNVYVFGRNEINAKVLIIYTCVNNTADFTYALNETDLSNLTNQLKSY